MKNDRPKVIVVCALLLAGGAVGVAFGAAGVAAGRPGAVNLILPGALLGFFGVLLVLILANDPFANRPEVPGGPRRTGRGHMLHFTVGEAERHDITYRWDQVWGWVTVTVDDVLIVKQLVVLSFRLVRVLEFPVGDRERHTVRIEKRRALFVSFAQPQPLQAFVDGTLVASDDGVRTA